MKKKYKIYFFILLSFLIGVMIITYGPIKGAYNRYLHTPELIKNNQFIYLDIIPDKGKAIRDFYDIYIQKKGYSGLKQKRYFDEGSTAILYLAANDGKLTLIIDYTRDPFSIRGFIKESPKDVLIGTISDNKYFLPLPSSLADSNNIKLKVIRATGEEILL